MYKDVKYPDEKSEFYRFLKEQIKLYTRGESDFTAVLSNASAVLKIAFERANWTGFYLRDGDELKLGPFQGRPAVTRIPFGSGVCGTAWKKNQSIVVEEVECFEGHIACDCNTHAEIVIPMYKNGEFLGVLDMDSVDPGYFTEDDRKDLEDIVGELIR